MRTEIMRKLKEKTNWVKVDNIRVRFVRMKMSVHSLHQSGLATASHASHDTDKRFMRRRNISHCDGGFTKEKSFGLWFVLPTKKRTKTNEQTKKEKKEIEFF